MKSIKIVVRLVLFAGLAVGLHITLIGAQKSVSPDSEKGHRPRIPTLWS